MLRIIPMVLAMVFSYFTIKPHPHLFTGKIVGRGYTSELRSSSSLKDSKQVFYHWTDLTPTVY